MTFPNSSSSAADPETTIKRADSAIEAPMESPHMLHRGDDTLLVRKSLATTRPATAKEVGSTWVTTYNGKLWPVIICGEDGLPPAFINQRRGPHEIPVIVLGRHMYIFAAAHNLREFDPHHNYLSGMAKFEQPDFLKTDDEPTKVEKQRRRAFEQDAPEYKDAAYWHNFIIQKSKARKVEAEIAAQHIRKQNLSTPKRRRQDHDSNSSGSHKRHATGEKIPWKELKGIVTPKSPNKKPKLDASAPEYAHLFRRSRDNDMDEDYDNSDGRTNKPFAPRNSDDVFVVDKRRSLNPLAARKREWRPAPPPMGPNMCRILIDAKSPGVIIPLAAVERCTYLLERQGVNMIASEHIVDLRNDRRALRLALSESDLHKIYDFLHTGKIAPDVANVGSPSERKKLEYVEKLAMAFVTASKIQHEYLQETIQHKLCMAQPLPPLGVVIVATAILSIEVSNKVEKFLRDWIIDHIQYNFWAIAEKAAPALEKVMTDHDLHSFVFSKVGERMGAARLAALNNEQIGASVEADTVESHGHNQEAVEGTSHDHIKTEPNQMSNSHFETPAQTDGSGIVEQQDVVPFALGKSCLDPQARKTHEK